MDHILPLAHDIPPIRLQEFLRTGQLPYLKKLSLLFKIFLLIQDGRQNVDVDLEGNFPQVFASEFLNCRKFPGVRGGEGFVSFGGNSEI